MSCVVLRRKIVTLKRGCSETKIYFNVVLCSVFGTPIDYDFEFAKGILSLIVAFLWLAFFPIKIC